MNEVAKQAAPEPKPADTAPKAKKGNALTRITLELLEQYAAEHERKGSDPYNTRGSPANDQWRGNARRI